MAGRARLRTQKKKRRRLLPVILLLFLLGSGYWCFVNRGQVLDSVRTFFKASGDHASDGDVRRGTIFDRNGKVLAVSLDKVSVYANVRDLDSLHETAMRLAPAVDESAESLLQKLKSDSMQVWLARNISQTQEQAVRRLGLKGIFLQEEKVRYYPQKKKAAQFLGYTENQMGLAGVEYTYNQWLNRYGNSSWNEGDTGDKGAKGSDHNLILTIDLKIQDILYKYVTDIGAVDKGIRLGAMVMDAKSGNVIGCVNYPSYDPNHFREFKKSILGNILAEPAAIPENIRSFFAETVSLQSEYTANGRILPWSVASDTINPKTSTRFWQRLGLKGPLPLDFVAESGTPPKLQLLKKDQNSSLDAEGVPKTATPIRVMTALARILNGGKAIIPHVVDPEKNPGAVSTKPEKPGPAVSGEVAVEASQLFQAMDRSGPLASGTIAGSGLAFRKKGVLDDFLRNRIVLIMIPAKNPQLILMIAADLPGLDPGGSGVKGKLDLIDPAMKMITPIVTMQQVLTHLSDMMTVQDREKINYQPADSSHKEVLPSVDVRNAAVGPTRMPALIGLSLRKSLRLLNGAQITIHIHGTGRVVAQDPAPNTDLSDVKVCTLTLRPTVDRGRSERHLDKILNQSEGEDGRGIGK